MAKLMKSGSNGRSAQFVSDGSTSGVWVYADPHDSGAWGGATAELEISPPNESKGHFFGTSRTLSTDGDLSLSGIAPGTTCRVKISGGTGTSLDAYATGLKSTPQVWRGENLLLTSEDLGNVTNWITATQKVVVASSAAVPPWSDGMNAWTLQDDDAASLETLAQLMDIGALGLQIGDVLAFTIYSKKSASQDAFFPGIAIEQTATERNAVYWDNFAGDWWRFSNINEDESAMVFDEGDWWRICAQIKINSLGFLAVTIWPAYSTDKVSAQAAAQGTLTFAAPMVERIDARGDDPGAYVAT